MPGTPKSLHYISLGSTVAVDGFRYAHPAFERYRGRMVDVAHGTSGRITVRLLGRWGVLAVLTCEDRVA